MKPLAIIVLLAFASICQATSSTNLSADDILRASRDRNDGSSYATNIILRLIGSNSKVRERNLYMLQKDMANQEERAFMSFHSPADVRGVSFLISNYSEMQNKADDQWMYLPAFRKTRRIGSTDKRGSFMGSTFNYSDLDKIRVSDYKNTLIGKDKVLGRDAWLIERIPVDQNVVNKTSYHKTRVWIDMERKIVLQQHYYNAKDIVFKTQESIEVAQVQGIWTIMKSLTKNLDSNKSSEMVFTDIVYNVDIRDKQISQKALKKGIRSSDMPKTL